MKLFETDLIAVRDAEMTEAEQIRALPEFAALLDDTCRICAVTDSDGNLCGAIAQRRYAEWGMEGIIIMTLPEYRRKGYAADAVHSYTRWFYDNCGENMLIAVVDLENTAAVRTLERAGYEYIRTTTLMDDSESGSAIYHLFVCSRATADAGAPPRGCCCGCGGK